MHLVVAVTKNQTVKDLINQARQIAYKFFSEDKLKTSLSDYDQVAARIEKILTDSDIVVSDPETYERLNKVNSIQGIEHGELLVGYFDKGRANQVTSALKTILGDNNEFYIDVKTKVDLMEPDDILVFWNIGEEKYNDMFSA